MSETLRDLVVSLSLQTDNFTRNIKSVSRQIAEAESQFRLAAAGVEGFERTTTGLATQLSTLERRLSLQKDMVGQYQRALEAANNKLTECYNRQNDYAQRLETAKAAQQSLKEQVAATAQQVRTYSSTLGESNSATIAARANLDALKGEYRASVQEVKKLSGQNTALRKATQNAADAVSQASTNLNMAQAGVRQTEAEINRCNQSLRLAQTNWDAAGRSIDASRAAIATFGREINLAESKFRLATAGIKDMDTSVAGLSAKLTFLREKLEIQEKSVEQYENALKGAKEQLLAAQQANDPEKIRQASDAVIDAEAALNRARAAVRTTRAEIEDTNRQLATARSAWTAAGRTLESFGRSCDSVSRKLTTAGKALTTVLTTPILTLGTAAVKASLDFESSFAGVRKTVEATEAEFESLAASSKRMSTQIAASTTEINGVMATGGQLGIANEYLTNFTRVMIDLGNSCEDLSADEAATSIAKFANVMGTDQSLFQNIGSTIVDLGNNFATTEKPIMEMAQRLAGAGKQVGLTEAQVLGFAAALSSVGMFRNTADCLLYTRELKKRGIGVLFEEQSINTLDSTGELMLTILSSLAQDESRNISENTTWGIRSRFQQGHLHLNTNRFLGYDKDKDGNLIINPDQAKLVRRIYDSFLDGVSPDTIASQFRNEKIPTIMGTSNWQASTIYGILRNEKYKGDVLLQKWFTADFLSGTTVRNNGEVEQYYIKGNHEPIIEPVRWEVTQLELARREAFREKYGLRSLGRYTADQPFSNRVFCGLCNDLFWRRTWYRLGKDVKVWQCNKRYKEKGVVGCISKNLHEHDLHGAFVRVWNTVITERNERMKTWTAQMAGDDLLAAFYAERFTELTASGHLMQDIDLGIVAKVLDRVVFYGEHLDFYLLDGSKVTVKLAE